MCWKTVQPVLVVEKGDSGAEILYVELSGEDPSAFLYNIQCIWMEGSQDGLALRSSRDLHKCWVWCGNFLMPPSVSIKRMRATIQKRGGEGASHGHLLHRHWLLSQDILKWQQPSLQGEVTKRSLKSPIGQTDSTGTIPLHMAIPSMESATNGEILGGWISFSSPSVHPVQLCPAQVYWPEISTTLTTSIPGTPITTCEHISSIRTTAHSY